jgi:hypothetical protein
MEMRTYSLLLLALVFGTTLMFVACVPDADLSDERSPSQSGAGNAGAGLNGVGSQQANQPQADDGLPPQIQSLTLEPGDCVHASALPSKVASVTFAFRVGDVVANVTGQRRSDGWVDALSALPTLAPQSQGELLATALDAQGRAFASEPVPFTTPRARPSLVISEILANPAGSEYTQEYVELYNFGQAPQSLAGFTLEDSAAGDTLPEVVVPPKSYVLVVAAAFDTGVGPDPQPAASAVLVRVEGRLGRDGLSNSGETVTLRDAQGAIVSQYGGFVDTSATAWNGRSVHRVPPNDPCDQRGLWTDRPQPPSPGW